MENGYKINTADDLHKIVKSYYSEKTKKSEN